VVEEAGPRHGVAVARQRRQDRVGQRSLGIRFGLPAAKWMLEIGALVMGTETELILKSRRVVPGRLLDAGFQFDFPDWPPAARDLCKRWREPKHPLA
jgi:hypothetical protein